MRTVDRELHLAIEENSIPRFFAALEAGADVNSLYSDGNERTAFAEACANNRVTMVRIIIDNAEKLKLDVNKYTGCGFTALSLGVIHIEIVKLLLKNKEKLGLNVNLGGIKGPLYRANRTAFQNRADQYEIIGLLKAAGATE
jgi:hypothetical protein